jgi:hypothetical protein
MDRFASIAAFVRVAESRPTQPLSDGAWRR